MQAVARCIRNGALFAAVLGLALGLGFGATPAGAAQYSAIVLDMRDGTVLFESNADRRQSPASLTKMMTLYLAFEAVEGGQLSLDQKVRVSRHASRQPPSKLYLKAGQRVTIRSLIRATAVKSANDAAVALAEAIGGSEKAFARMMTARARQLGMRNTTFRNASGLTARGHLSTARDMAIMGRHLFFDFPDYYNIFKRKVDRAAGKRIYSTNRRLLSSYRGADGIKTGYTRAAGYTLVASARRGSKRVVAALFGGKSSRWRNARMAKLLDKGFSHAATRVAMVAPRAQNPAVAAAPLPPPRPGTNAGAFAVLAQALSSQAVAATPESTSRYAPLYTVLPPTRPGEDGADAVSAALLGNQPAPVPRPRWSVALGEFSRRAVAVARLTEIAMRDDTPLSAADPVIDVIGNGGAKRYRVRFIGLAQQDANKACVELHARGRDCVPIAPNT
ncbi:MAG: D-alanyl-D-alanine carboxypeptidase [Paracoccaceae bacterium]|nr:D-alanyl-D-alanine carboxypeptidase [Paracoccaceae bacterium]